MSRRSTFAALLILVVALVLAGCGGETPSPAPPPPEPVPTTLVKTYVPQARPGGGFDLTVGPGEPHEVLDPFGVGESAAAAKFWSLAYWHVSTDQHLVDEECPARATFFEAQSLLDGMLVDAYGPHEDISPQLWNAAVLTADAIMKGYGRDFDLALSLGDSADNGSQIEMEWLLQVADAPPPGFIRPDTGDWRIVNGHDLGERNLGSQEAFDPYNRPGYPNSNADFPAVGFRTREGAPLPWYGVVGNHDTLSTGGFPVDSPNLPLNDFLFNGEDYVGNRSLFGYLRGVPTLLVNTLEGGPTPPRGYYDLIGGPLIGCLISNPATLNVLMNILTDGEEAMWAEIDPDFNFSQVVPDPYDPKTSRFGVEIKEDPSRRFAGSQGLAELLRSGGHGFDPEEDECAQGPEGGLDPDKGYYTLDAVTAAGLGVPIRMIVLNGSEMTLVGEGGMSSEQFRWLKCELERARREHVLVVVASHQQESGFLTIGGEDGLPLCSSGEECARALEAFFLGYPNLFLHVTGHTHHNRISAHPDPANPARGYWEVQTTSASWWAQQTRVLEIVVHENGAGEIWSTMLDHAALSSSADTNTLTELARRLVLDDPHISVDAQGYPLGQGKADDRNRVLRFQVPAEIMAEIAQLPPSQVITSRDVFPGGQIP
jgi:hypothetical protein